MPPLTRPPRSTPSRADKNANFGDRMNAAAAARKATLERFHTRPGPDDPAVLEQQAARKAVSDAREVRVAERTAAREAEAQRQAAEQAAKAAEQAAREAEERRLAAEAAAQVVALEAQRKAARDARYAARKARR
jgi:hypothetical protein